MVKIEKDYQTKVLYVEDDPDIRENIEKLLKRRYEKVEVCVDGLEGLERFKEFQPNIIITDVLMPRMSGLSMSEEIRKIDNEVPIIVTTA
ncbi:MAG: response regulator, partial [Campylobacterales bacterium]|nr:response regulator [Campylobacterales bacterium]